MKYAVIQLSGKQYKVAVGDQITVNALHIEAGKEYSTSDVLMVADGKDIKIGAPLLTRTTVKMKVLDNHKADKIRVARYIAKSRYRKVRGHRQFETTLEVLSIA